MPEIVEVEIVKRSLKILVGKKLKKIFKFRKDKVKFEVPKSSFLERKVVKISRWGKYLIFEFSNDLSL